MIATFYFRAGECNSEELQAECLSKYKAPRTLVHECLFIPRGYTAVKVEHVRNFISLHMANGI